MKNGRSMLELAVGIIVICTVMVAVFFSFSEFSQKAGDTYTLNADFDSVSGLREGSPVKISGVTVGFIKSIRVDTRKYSAVVSFSVRKNIHIPKDSTVSVSSESLLGGKVLTIAPGNDSEIFSDGDTIYKTQSSMNIEDLLQKYMFSGEQKREQEPLSHDSETISPPPTSDLPKDRQQRQQEPSAKPGFD
ncbi:outer membrane lipid asymmetry maintenance protein MlaD [Candidatus Hydrogenosomobacter endosymbioticus]|uniref:Mce/MlaD domain-containing protein n=1 Tax=Candidatus Hydrogenosomobacter endosymbioticus TaxID=2558174 RepID=A0ABM7V883_9PROT|nr:outer membrane lipid asymmetry maintenance protein MlaD [Candidatus Hydrogenosomobacter endosymbioticus]BDB95980.1 hypothetical protein HYD_1130 [Candidatus Hydrogenosomobacter endosymbioticus]